VGKKGLNRDFPSALNFVIDETTSHSTKPASWQVAGYPAQAGIQLIKNFCKAGQKLNVDRYAECFFAGFPPARE
jgi:hypothetical protein